MDHSANDPRQTHPALSAVLQRHAVVIHAARCGSVEALRTEAVVCCVRELCAEVERLCAKIVRDDAPPGDADAWVRIAVQAEARGFANADSFRRWCRRRKVPMNRVGKVLFVRAADIDRAIEMASRIRGSVHDDAVRATVAQLTARGR